MDSQYRRRLGRRPRAVGAAVACCGAVAFVAYPVFLAARRVPWEFVLLFDLAYESASLGAVLVVWGLSAAAFDRFRTLTGGRALAAAALAPIPYAVGSYYLVPPPLLVDDMGWNPPPASAFPVEYLHGFADTYPLMGPPLFLLAGVAVARGRRPAALLAVGAFLATGVYSTNTLAGVGAYLLDVTPVLFPAIAFLVGRQLAVRPNDVERTDCARGVASG